MGVPLGGQLCSREPLPTLWSTCAATDGAVPQAIALSVPIRSHLERFALAGCVIAFALGLCFPMAAPAQNAIQHAVSRSTDAVSGMRQAGAATITGVVRNRETDVPVAGVVVQILDGGQRTETGEDGRYAFDALAPGAHMLRCVRGSYEPLTVVVTVNDGAESVVDVGLVALPQVLPLVSVVASTAQERGLYDQRNGAIAPMRDALGMGGTTWSAEAIRRSPQLAQSDVLRAVATASTVATRSEAPSSIHVTGGSADQNLILLDGIPIENAVHAGDLTSAVDPAAVDAVTLYDGRMPASLGGRLASVIAISTRGDLIEARRTRPVSAHTRERGGRPISVVGTAGTAGMGATFTTMSRGLNASGLFSVRHSPRSFGQSWFADPQAGQPAGDGWSDVLARGSMWLGHGELSVLGFVTHDAVRFDARGGTAADGAADGLVGGSPDTPVTGVNQNPNQSPDQHPATRGRAFFADTSNGFAWRSSAVGITWRRPIGAATELDLRAWQSVAVTSGAWGIGVQRAALSNRLVHSGAVAAVTRTTPNTWVNAGVSLDNISTVYAASAGDTIATSTARITLTNPAESAATAGLRPHDNFRLTAAPRLISAFVDTRWRITPWASASVGLRATSLLSTEARGSAGVSASPNSAARQAPPQAAPHIEPRLGLTISPISRLTLEAVYSRTEQRVQSLRNDESLFDNVIGLNLLSATGNGIPIATSDLGSTRANFSLSPSVVLSGGAYTRRLQNIVLAAPRAAAPFATDTFDIGSGHASGWYIAAQHATDHVQLDASYSVTHVSRGTTQMRYRPGFAAARSLSFGISIRPLAHTTFRAAGFATEGRNAAMTLGDFTWDWEQAAGTSRSFQGTPRTALIGGSHLPPYLRLDLGTRHEIPLGRGAMCGPVSRVACGPSTLTVFASVNNVFNRMNTAGYVRNGMVSPNPTGLGLLPRSVVAGLEWHW